MRIAMWSGPRNLSTAMMYAFGARADCAVWDEPFYAAFLKRSGIDHPMREKILASGEVDPDKVAAHCLGDIPGGKPVFYQKHMCHHMIAGLPRDWMTEVTNVFLIRHPARVLASYEKKRTHATFDDIGFSQQTDLFEQVRDMTGDTPVVVDSHTIRQNPETALKTLCSAIGLPFDSAMLAWPAGGHDDDGAWAPHWYPEIWKSTGFAAPEPEQLPDVPNALHSVFAQALPIYERLSEMAIKPD